MAKTLLSPGKRNPLVLGIATVILVGIVALSYDEWRQHNRANSETFRSQAILDSVDRLLEGLLDAEAGERGFLLTGDWQYLKPCHRALLIVPTEMSNLKRLAVRGRPEWDFSNQLNILVDQRLAEIRQAVEPHRTTESPEARNTILSDRNTRTMNGIRILCGEIRHDHNLARNSASLRGETTSQIALLITTTGSLILLFFVIAGVEPFISENPQAKRRRPLDVYGNTVLVIIAATSARFALAPLMGERATPFITYFPAVLFAAWYGGLRAGALTILLSAVVADYFFATPVLSFQIGSLPNQVDLLLFIIVSTGMALLSRSARMAVERADWEGVRRQEAENAEQMEQQRSETTLESIGDAVISTDAVGRIVFANSVALFLLRYSKSEIARRRLDEVIHIVNEFTRKKVESPVTSAMREGTVVGLDSQTVLIDRDGTEIPIDHTGAPIRGKDGKIVGAVMVFRDVTARRVQEGASRLLASIVESSQDAIISLDLGGGVTSWNKAAERIFGYSRAEMIGSSISVLAAPEVGDAFPHILEPILEGGWTDSYETVQRTKKGELINVSITASPLRDARKRIIGVSKIARDITARVRSAEKMTQLNADLQKSNENLARLNKDLENFAFVASHDLQEPLRMITAYAQLLVKTYSGQLDRDATLFVDNIVEGTRRMRELLWDLLAYLEVDAPPEGAPEAVDLNLVVKDVAQNLQLSIQEGGAVITCDPLPTLNAYKYHLIPLFQNLIANAIKYRNQDPLRIHVSVEDQGKDWRFAVADNGRGISPEHYTKIFEVFKRLHGTEIRGTGVGLAICQRVVERYGGRIWVDSQPGLGATFSFTMPKNGPLQRQA